MAWLTMNAGCSTLSLQYKPRHSGNIGGGAVVQVGAFQNALGFDDPAQIRSGKRLDRPVVDFFWSAVVTELEAAGFVIGPSTVEVSGTVERFGNWGSQGESTSTIWAKAVVAFRVSIVGGGRREAYSRTFRGLAFALGKRQTPLVRASEARGILLSR